MADQMERKGITLDIRLLEKKLNTQIALVSTRKNTGIDTLKYLIATFEELNTLPCVDISGIDSSFFEELKLAFPDQNLYELWSIICQEARFGKQAEHNLSLEKFKIHSTLELKRLQQKEAVKRYQFINSVLKDGQKIDKSSASDFTSRLDRVLTHNFWGYVIFFLLFSK
jgi:ferrous iron transport protein B